jgi:hypothetical protein
MDSALARDALATIEKQAATITRLEAEVERLSALTKSRDDSTSILKAREARALEPGLDSPGVLPGTAELRKRLFTGDAADRIAKDRKATG